MPRKAKRSQDLEATLEQRIADAIAADGGDEAPAVDAEEMADLFLEELNRLWVTALPDEDPRPALRSPAPSRIPPGRHP